MWRCAVVFAAGCGRIGFGGAGGGPSDAVVDDDALTDAKQNADAVLADAAIDAVLDAPADAAPLICPSGYTMVGPGCYRLVTDIEQTWAMAEADCEADASGAHLAVLDDAAELARVATFANLPLTLDAWIGTTDRLVEGTYRTVNGAPAFVVLAPQQGDAGEDCLEVRSEDETAMFDSDCSEADDYICEYDGIAVANGTF